MGREARVTQASLPKICYLCGKGIVDKKQSDLDHVPPQRFFARSIRKKESPQLPTLRVHKACNRGYKPDEEYFFTTLVGEANSATGQEAWKDLKESFKHPKYQGLLKKVIGEFGKVALPDGKVARYPQWPRLQRVGWKIVRGLYFRDTGLVLPEATPHLTDIYNRNRMAELPDYFRAVRDTESKGRYGAVFDYKTFVNSGETPLCIYALLLWDAVIVLVPFHNPLSCQCDECKVLKGAE